MADNSFLKSPLETVTDSIASQPVTLPPIQSASDTQAKTSSLLPPPSLRPIFDAAAKKFNVPVNVLMALGSQESSYNPNAVGTPTKWGRAKGVMQYLDGTAKDLGINPFNPDEAIPAAAQQLRQRLDKGYSIEDAIKEHFAGPDRQEWGPKTAAYGQQVMARVGKIGDLLGVGATGAQPSQSTAELQAQLNKDEPGRYEVLDDNYLSNHFNTSLPRPVYEYGFKMLNPGADDAAVQNAMQAYDVARNQASQQKAQAVQDQFQTMQSPEATFQQKLDQRLAGPQNGIVPQLPTSSQAESNYQQELANEQAQSGKPTWGDAASYLEQSGKSGLYQMAGAGAKLLDDINPWTLSEQDAAVLFKNDPAKLKEYQDNSAAMILSRFANSMQNKSTEAMQNVSPGAKSGYENLQYATTDASKSAFLSPVRIIGDAIQSLPTMAAMAFSAYLTRGASTQAEKDALAAGLSADEAKQAGIHAAEKVMANTSAVTEGAVGYAQNALQTHQQLSEMSDADMQKSPLYQKLIGQEYSPQAARSLVISHTSDQAGSIGGIADGAVNKIGGKFLGEIMTEGGPFIARVMKGFATEGTTEGVQSPLEQLGQNWATQQNVDKNQSLLEGTGEQALQGLAVGGLSGGAFGGVAGHPIHGAEAAERAPEQTAPEQPLVTPAPQAEAQAAPAPAPAQAEQAAPAPQEKTQTVVPPAPSDAAGPLARSVENAAAEPARVTVTAPQGQITGFVQSHTRDAQGNFVLRMLGDDGQPYTFTNQDGVQIEQASGPLTAALQQAAAVHQTPATALTTEQMQSAPAEQTKTQQQLDQEKQQIEQAVQQAQPQPAPPEVKLEDMSEQDLRARLKYLATQAKNSGGWNKLLMGERKKVEAQINQRVEAAKAAASDTAKAQPSAPAETATAEKAAPVKAQTANPDSSTGFKATHTDQFGTPIAKVDGEWMDEHGTVFENPDVTPIENSAQPRDEYANKWFGSKDKAEAFIARKNIGETHEAVQTGKVRFEIKPKDKQISGTNSVGATETDKEREKINQDWIRSLGDDGRRQALIAAGAKPSPENMVRMWWALTDNTKRGLEKLRVSGWKPEAEAVPATSAQQTTGENHGQDQQEGRQGQGRQRQEVLSQSGAAETVAASDIGPNGSIPYDSDLAKSEQDGFSVQFEGKKYPIKSLQDASDKWVKFRDETGEGASVLGGGVPVLNKEGKQVAFISYNGRIWNGDKYGNNQRTGWQSNGGKEVAGRQEAAAATAANAHEPNAANAGRTEAGNANAEHAATEAGAEKAAGKEEVTPPEPNPPKGGRSPDGRFANNKIFTADKVEQARARLKQKLSGSQLNAGIDPELLMDGMTIAGAYIEAGTRQFSAYAKAMAEDFGDKIKPFLLSFYEAARNYPGIETDGMSSIDEAKAEHAAMMKPADIEAVKEAVGEIQQKPAKRTKKTGAKSDIALTQDWGVDHIDGYGNLTREEGNDVKDAFLAEARKYLNAVASVLAEQGYMPQKDAKGRDMKPVSVNESGTATSGEVNLTMYRPDGGGIYVNIGGTTLRGVVPSTPSGVAIMFRQASEADKYGTKSVNRWAPVDLSAADLAVMLDKEAVRASGKNATPAMQASEKVDNVTTQGEGNANDTAATQAGADRGAQDGAPEPVRQPAAEQQAGRSAEPNRGESGRFDFGGEAGGDRGSHNAGESGVRGGPNGENANSEQRLSGRGARSPAAGNRGNNEPRSSVTNYRIQPGELKREGSWRTTAERNVQIVELVKKIMTENRQATPEERALLAKFTGWGASEIANGIFPDRFGRYKDATWQALGERLKAALGEEEYAQARRTTQYAHYTSEGVIRSIYSGLQRLGFSGGTIVEPGMGVGNFIGLMPDGMAANSHYTGIEYDSLTGNIAKLLYPESNIIVGDYTKTNLPKDFFDAAIGNPPFSSTQILSDPEYKNRRPMLHDYFFMKTIDRVKPGGVLVFVTSKGTMDKTSDKSRRYLAERANLLGAVRLPQTAFKDNAGTEVVTDVIFLQKKGNGVQDNGVQWLGTKSVQTKDGPAEINQYFADHPEMVLGTHALQGSMYRSNEYTVLPPEGDIEELFSKAVSKLPEAVFRPAHGSLAERAAVQERDFNPKLKKEGGLYLSDDGRLMQVENGSGIELNHRTNAEGKQIALTPKQKKWLRDYVGLRDALKQAQYDQLNDGDWEKSLKQLNKTYDAFVKANGNILEYSTIERTNPETGETTEIKRYKNEPLLRMDAEGALAYALEQVKEDGSIIRGAVLNERVLERPREPEIKTTQDALFVSLNRNGGLYLDDVASLAGTTKDAVIQDLGTSIYESPGKGWQLADEYLSGNVVRKLKEAKAASEIDPKYKRNVEALLAVQPRPLGPTDITVRLGANWVPPSDIAAFAREALGEDMSVDYSHMLGKWDVSQTSRNMTEWGFDKMTAGAILDGVLNNRQLKVTYRDSEGKTHVDLEATEKANDIASKMRDKFRSWIWTDTKRSERLVNYYNEHFNNIAPRQFDGSHLTLPGISARYKLYEHQKRAVWRIVQQGDTYLAHAVGAGKTIEMIAGGMEERRLGLVKKPMYAVPNHMLAQFSREFLELYPTANIMVADEHNFHTHNRRRFVAQAALNDPDAIVITHSAFGRIGMGDEFYTDFINRQIDQWKEALDEVDSGDRITTKQIERRIEQLEQRLEGRQGKDKKDQVLTFEELGVDRLYVDEFHEFRKLDFATNQGNVKGIDPNGSQRALDLYMKVEHIRAKNPTRALVAASGTPVTNTMGELYTAQRFFQPEQLKEDGLDTFDAWSNQYGDIVTGFEQNAAGGYEMVARFARFQNVPELMRRVRSFMDILTSSNLGELVKRPEVEGGSRDVIVTPPPEGYKEYQQELQKRIQTIRNRKGPPKKGDDIILNVIGDGRFSAIDMRFVHPEMQPDPHSKLNQMLDALIKDYHDTAHFEYVGMDGKVDPLKGASHIVFTDIGLGEQSAASRGFNMRDWIEKRLTDGGIPRDHIAFMRDYKQHSKKERLFADMRDGKKRVLIGGKEMETGTNVQKRLYTEDHLDAPWFPASVEQREGRIVRQGNQNKEVKIRAWATKGSYDSTMWGMNARKARFIEQAMNGDDSVRSLEDVSEASAFEMAAAMASGDQRYMQLAGLKSDVDKLERLRAAHYDDQNRLMREKHWAEQAIERNTERANELEAAIAKRKTIRAGEFLATVGNKPYDNREEFSQALFKEAQKLAGKELAEEKTIGEIGGFPIKFYGLDMQGGNFAASVHVDLPGDPNALLNFPLDPETAVTGIATRAANQVNGLDRDLAEARRYIESNTAKIEQINKRIGAAFPEESLLLEKLSELSHLENELAKESEPNNADAAAATEEVEGKDTAIEQQPEEPRYSISESGSPVAEFGPVTAEFKNDPAGAIKYLLAQRTGEAIINSPALGEISLVYGDDRMGLKHIIDRRGEDFLKNLPALLESSTVYEKPKQTKRVFLGNDAHEATIRLDWNGQAKAWLVSAYEKYPDLSVAEAKLQPALRSQVVQARTGMSADALRAHLSNGPAGQVISDLIANKQIVLHNGMATMPKAARGVRGVQAVTMPDGTIHMHAGNLRENNALAVLSHEIFQAGGRDFLGSKEWSSLMGRLGSLYRQSEMSTGKAREFFDRARERVAEAKRKGAVTTKNEVEEFGAYAIEEWERTPETVPAAIRKWVEDVIGHVKAWMQKNFGAQIGKVTPAQLAALARMVMIEAHNKLIDNEQMQPQGQELPKYSAGQIPEPEHNIELAAHTLLDLADEEGMFTYGTSNANTLDGVFHDILPDVEYLGDTTREDERQESTADHRYTFKMPSGHAFYVYTTDDGKVWIDVSRLEPGEGGQGIYWAVANYAYNNGDKFVADPYGLSGDALFRRTANMLATAIRFGTTQHIEPGEQQLRGDYEQGVDPLEWKGTDFDKIKSLIDTHVASVINHYPALENYRYDFNTNQFVGPDGRPVERSRFDYVGGSSLPRGGKAGSKTLRRAIFLKSLLSATADQEPGIVESSYRRAHSIVQGSGPLFSVSPDEREAVLESADRAIDAPAPKDDYIGHVVGDISLASRLINHPRQVAAVHKEFTPVYRTAISQMEARDKNISDLGADVKSYDHLDQASKENVNKALELGRLTSNVYTAAELRDGVTNTGTKTVVSMADGKPKMTKAPIHSLLTDPGEVVKLNDQEIKAYQDLRNMFDRALDKMRDQTLTDLGFEEFVGEKNAAKAIIDSITDQTPPAQAEKLRNIANFVAEIEQAKRAGYVPFARYGDYVVSVKEKVANVHFIEDDKSHLIAEGLPDSFAQDMLDLGAEKVDEGWRIPTSQRNAVERMTEKTIYSTKVETGLGDKLSQMTAKKVDDIKAVKEAIEQARKEWVGDDPNRRIVAFKVRQKNSEQPVKLSDVDALAEVANLDPTTWDAVRDKLSDAIKSKGFRSHFFHSDDVPGYTGDFERSIADYVIGMSGYLARRQHAKQWENTVTAIKDKPKLYNYAAKYRDYVNNPQEELAIVRQIGFFSYISGVMASAFANLTQVPLLSVPTLSQVAPAPLVIKEIAKAYKDAAQMISAKAGLDMFDPNRAPADVREIMKQAWDEGSFVPLESFDLMMTARQRNVGTRQGVKAFNTATQVVSMAFTFAERMNRLVTFIAAARLAEKHAVQENSKKVLKDDALARAEILRDWNPKSFAEWSVDESQFRMGKYNRPTMMRGIGSAIMQFKGFMIQTMEAWYRMAALHGKEGKFAAASSLLAMYALTGLWGLPGADDLRKLIENIYNQITGEDLDLKTELRSWIARKSGSQALSVMASKGVPYIYGVDLTRVGMGSIAPDSPLAAAGIPLDMMIGRPKRAFAKYESGDTLGAAAELTPNFIKNWLVSGSWALQGVRDSQGNRILLPSDLSNYDLGMKALGFTPSIVTDVRDYEYAQHRMETAVDQLKRRYVNELAKAMVQAESPDPATVKQAQDRMTAIYDDIDEHNANADPEGIIKIDARTLRGKIMREEAGVKETWGRERKQARGAAEELRKVFGLSQEDDQQGDAK